VGQESFRKDFQKDILKELKAHQSDLRQELRRELQVEVQSRRAKLETDLTREIRDLGGSTAAQFQEVQQGIQTAERGIRDLAVAQGSVESRLQALEARGSDAGTTAAPSTQSGPGGRRPALVLGGWDPDTASADMLREAQKFVNDLRLDLDLDDVFVPGVRRGFAILPYSAREGESVETMRARIQGAMAKVKAANAVMHGRERPVWLVPSRSPAERRRSALAGKTKRLILQLSTDSGGRAPELEVEWGSGTVWLQGARVASAASSPPSQSEPVSTGGWIDLGAIASKLRLTTARVKKHWEPLAAALR
jgi:hypothetical protein